MQPGDLTLSLFIDGAWSDVSADVMVGDGVTITRGSGAESDTVEPGSCEFTLIDADRNGKYSSDVPGSPNYGKIGLNTQVRVALDSGTDIRFIGEISSWEPSWDESENRVLVRAVAAGILRRLNQGTASLRPPAYRSAAAAGPVAYWPLSDGSDSTQAGSDLANVAPMALTGSMSFASISGPLGLSQQPELLGVDGEYTGQLTGSVAMTANTVWQIDVSVYGQPHSGLVNDQMNVIGFDIADTTKFVRGELNLVHDNGAGATQINVYFYDTAGNIATFLADNGLQTIDGTWHHLTISLVQTGASTMDLELWADGAIVNSVIGVVSGQIGRISRVYTPGRVVDGSVENFTSLSVANLAVYNNDSDPTDRYQGAIGYTGETAGRRVERLCEEENITFASIGDLDDTQAVGPQLSKSLLALILEAAAVDQGDLVETRDALGVTYRTRVSKCNQIGPLVSYSGGYFTSPMSALSDDQAVHNDVTVSRPSGSSAHVTLDDAVDPYHTRTTQDPPDGAGRYDRGTFEANVATDDQLDLLAYWRLHFGTWGERRFRLLTTELHNSAWQANEDLLAATVALDTGAHLRIDDMPVWLPPGPLPLIVRGYTEAITSHTRTITWNLAPGRPWEVWQLDSGGSSLAVAVTSGGTSLKLDTALGPAWKTGSPLDNPYHLLAAGNAMTVSTMATETATFVATGTVSHGNNASVTPGLPAGVQAGDLLVLFAAIRNNGTGFPNVPSGWSYRHWTFGLLVAVKYAAAGEVAPTVTFSSGVANADTSAQICAFRGASTQLGCGTKASPGVSWQANGSAQNIDYPALNVHRDGCVIIYAGWKQDDWTSVTGPGTEIGEPDTTTGDDQGIAWYYQIQTAATNIAAGSFTVTGGAAAVSEAAVLALRPLQTATVTRGVNGVSTALDVGEAVHAYTGVLSL